MASEYDDVSGIPEAGELQQYQPIPWRAVASLTLGVASLLALVGAAWWFIPLLAIGFGAATLRGSSEVPSAGSARAMAKTGIVLALLFGSWGPAQLFVHRHALFEESRQHAETWLELVQQGEVYQFFQLSQLYVERVPATYVEQAFRPAEASPSGSPYGGGSMEGQRTRLVMLEEFLNKPVVKLLLELGEAATYRYDGRGRQHNLGTDGKYVEQRFTVIYERDGQLRELPFVIVMRLVRHPNDEALAGQQHWNVEDVVTPQELAIRLS